jgi:hypothetical protein
LWWLRAGVGQAGLPAVAALRGRRGSGVQGAPVGASRIARCAAPWRSEGRPRILAWAPHNQRGVAAFVVCCGGLAGEELGEGFGWGVPAQGFTGSAGELRGDLGQVFGAMHGQVGARGELLAQQSGGVFVGAVLPG